MRKLIPRFILDQYKRDNVEGEFDAAVIFADISGFTAMTEALLKQGRNGAEFLSQVINSVFTKLMKVVYDHGGFISEFAGDAFTAIFPLPCKGDLSKICKSINEEMIRSKEQSFEGHGFLLKIKQGAAAGRVNWRIFGGKDSASYSFFGDPIRKACELQTKCSPGEFRIQKGAADIKCKIAYQKDKNFSTPYEIQRIFIPPKIMALKVKGEFRHVITAFIGLDSGKTIDSIFDTAQNIKELIQSYGGYFNGLFFNDKGPHILAVFGAPSAYEQDVVNVGTMALKASKDFGVDIGLASGLAFCGFVGSARRSAYTVLGDTANLSARIMSLSKGNILLPQSALKYFNPIFDTKYFKSVDFKGKEGKYRISKLTRIKKDLGSAVSDTRFFGRESELKQLQKHILFSTAKGYYSPFFISGPAGIGKTTLWMKAVTDSGYRHLVIRGNEMGAKGLVPFSEAIKSFIGIRMENSPEERLEIFNSYFSILREKTGTNHLWEEFPHLQGFLEFFLSLGDGGRSVSGLSPEMRHKAIGMAIKTFCKIISRSEGMILICEDVSWYSEESRAMANNLTVNMQNEKFALIMASRDGTDFNALREELYEEIKLLPFSKEELRGLLSQIIGGELSLPMVEKISKKSRGNPLFAKQLAAFIKENSLMVKRGNRMFLKNDLKDLPNDLNHLLISRIDSLPMRLNRLVKIASILGPTFSIGLLREISGRSENISVVVTEGEAAGIWTFNSDTDEIGFVSGMLRESAYSLQLGDERKSLHRKTANALFRLFGLEDAYLPEMARHYFLSGNISKSKELLPKAITYLRDNFRNMEALETISMLQKIEKGKRRSLELEIEYLIVMTAAGAWRKALPICRQTLLNALRTGEKKPLNAVRIILGQVLMYLGEYEQALKEVAQARAYFLKVKNYDDLILSHRITSLIQYYLLDFSAAKEPLKTALALTSRLPLKSRKKERSALYVNKGLIFLKEGKISRAMIQYQKALDIACALSAIDAESIALGNVGTIHYMRGNISLAEEYFEKALVLATQVGAQKNVSVMSLNLGSVYFRQGDYDKALKTFERTRDSALEIGNVRTLMKAVGNIGTIYAMKKDYLKAIETYKKKLILVEKLEDSEGLCYTFGNIAEAYNLIDQKADAEENFIKAIETAQKLKLEFNIMYHMSAYGQYLITNSRLPEAADLVKRAYSISWKYERNEDAFYARMIYGLYLYRVKRNSGVEVFRSLKTNATELEQKRFEQFMIDFEIVLDDD